MGQLPLNKLTAQQIQRTYNDLQSERDLSPKTIKNIHGVLHRAMDQALKLGYIRTNPLDAVILPRMEKKQVQTLDDRNLIAFLRSIEGSPYRNAMFVAVFTGLRQGELLGLTWDCVDFEHNTLFINKQHNYSKKLKDHCFAALKNDRARTLTVAEDVMEVLERQRQSQKAQAEIAGALWNNEKNLVFTTETGRYINNKTLYMNFKWIMAGLGLSEMRFHDLCHSYAVNSLRVGGDIKTVQENLGHATASFTLSISAHATPGMKQESAARMERFIRPMQSAIPNECKQTI